MKAFSFDWAAGLNASDIWKRKFSFQVPGATLAWWMELSLTPQSELFQLRGNVPQTRLMYFQQILGNSYLLRTQSLCTCCSDFVICLRFIPFTLLDVPQHVLGGTVPNCFGSFSACCEGWWVSPAWAQCIFLCPCLPWQLFHESPERSWGCS